MHYFLVLNNSAIVLLSGCTIDYLSIHLLKDVLVAFRFLTILIKAAINICVQVFVWTQFSAHLGKYQGAGLRIILSVYV